MISAFCGAVQYWVKFVNTLLSSFIWRSTVKLVYIMGLTPDSNVILNVSWPFSCCSALLLSASWCSLYNPHQELWLRCYVQSWFLSIVTEGCFCRISDFAIRQKTVFAFTPGHVIMIKHPSPHWKPGHCVGFKRKFLFTKESCIVRQSKRGKIYCTNENYI